MSSMVEMHSLLCPGCGDRITIAATVKQFMTYMNRDQFVQDIFPELDAETRERFISGVCPPCWADMYPEGVCEDCGGGCDGACEFADEEDFVAEADFLGVGYEVEADLLFMADDDTYDTDWYVED